MSWHNLDEVWAKITPDYGENICEDSEMGKDFKMRKGQDGQSLLIKVRKVHNEAEQVSRDQLKWI